MTRESKFGLQQGLKIGLALAGLVLSLHLSLGLASLLRGSGLGNSGVAQGIYRSPGDLSLWESHSVSGALCDSADSVVPFVVFPLIEKGGGNPPAE